MNKKTVASFPATGNIYYSYGVRSSRQGTAIAPTPPEVQAKHAHGGKAGKARTYDRSGDANGATSNVAGATRASVSRAVQDVSGVVDFLDAAVWAFPIVVEKACVVQDVKRKLMHAAALIAATSAAPEWRGQGHDSVGEGAKRRSSVRTARAEQTCQAARW
jgi:hypothetical protein